MAHSRAWQTVEVVTKGTRVVSTLEIDCGVNADGVPVELRYQPFAFDNSTPVMAMQAQWWSQFGPQAPNHRSVVVVSRSQRDVHFQERYPGYGLPTHTDGSLIISADAAEIALIRESIQTGLLLVEGRRVTVSPSSDSSPNTPLVARMLERMYLEGRMLYFPAGRSDFRNPPIDLTGIDLVAPLSCYAGTVPEHTKAHDAVAGFNSGFFIFPEEEFNSDPYTFALDPVGLVIANGKVMSPPVYERSALITTRTLHLSEETERRYSLGSIRPVIAQVGLEQYAVRLPHGLIVHGEKVSPHRISTHLGHTCTTYSACLNPVRDLAPEEFAFFNRKLGILQDGKTATHTPPSDRIEIGITGTQICSLHYGGGTFIPSNGLVISLPANSLTSSIAKSIQSGYDLTINQAIDAGPHIISPVSGSHVSLRLIINGTPVDSTGRFGTVEEFVPWNESSGEWGIPPIHLYARNFLAQDRSFIGFGIRPDYRCYVVAIEGTEPRSFFPDVDSVGGSLNDVTDKLLRLGCTEAVALDSGGSAEIFFRGKSLIRPSDRNDIPLLPVHRLAPGGWLVG